MARLDLRNDAPVRLNKASRRGARLVSLAWAVSFSLLACGGTQPDIKTPTAKPALVTDMAGPSATPLRPMRDRWIVDNATSAFRLAKATGRPVFVDVWATWCHTCLHMREFVLDDESVRPLESSAIWLSLDSDRPENAKFLEAHPAPALPTFFMFSQDSNELQRWVGSMDTEQLGEFVGQGGSMDPALATLTSQSLEHKNAECTQLALRELNAGQPANRFWTRFAMIATGLDCVSTLVGAAATAAPAPPPSGSAHHAPPRPKGPASKEEPLPCPADSACAQQAQLHTELTRLVDLAIARPEAELLAHADDISSGYELLSDHASKADKIAVASRWAAFLETRAAHAKTSEARHVFDPHRVLAYLAMEAPEKALPMLEKARLEQPKDFNPPARLARVYTALKRYNDAYSASEEALHLVYGPRTLRVYAQYAEAAKAQGDAAHERAILTRAVAAAEHLWLPPSGQKLRDVLEKRLRDLPPTK